MKLSMKLSAIAIVMVLAACYQSVPKCGDTETIVLVKQISDREMVTQLGAEAAKMFSYEVQAIRTTSTNEKTGEHECAAELKIKASNGASNSIPITYTVEKTDDGKQFYVNVFGLK